MDVKLDILLIALSVCSIVLGKFRFHILLAFTRENKT